MIKNRNAVITGSTSGIGLAMAEAFAGAGANIMLNGLGDAEEIEATRARLETTFGVKVVYSAANMLQPEEISGMISDAASEFGKVDILVNNAGIQHVAPIEEFPAGKWDAIIAINLSAAFHSIRAVVPLMKETGWGRIINTASAHALVASPYKSAYVAAKHGIAGLTKTVALEVAEHGVDGQRHRTRLCADTTGGKPDSGHREGARHHRRRGQAGRPACRPTHQGIRHRRRSRRPCPVPVFGRCRVDHRCDIAD